MSVRLQAEVISYRFGLDSADCDVTLVLPGTVERLRPQLARALERVGYHVVSEDPLQARRGGAHFSLNVLKYPLSLHIGFKPAGEQATQVTFSYSLKHSGLGWITKGDLPVLAQEAEAIAAVALQGARAPLCTRCGGENPAGSRFCRRCGALLAVLEPAELDVLNLVARNRAAYLALLTGSAGLALMTVCLALLLFDLPAKLEGVVIFLGLLAGAFGWGWGIWGIYGLRQGMGRRGMKGGLRPRVSEEPAMPPLPSSAFSVTEGTTQLLEGASSPISGAEGTTQLLDEAPPPPSRIREREMP
ncbi:hypothetical protein HRbin10_01233 [bacterium HR10]|nr:hypothetical protein HRbin10_01233 [bacterium HR10]